MKVSMDKESASAQVRLTSYSLNLRAGRDLGSMLPHGGPWPFDRPIQGPPGMGDWKLQKESLASPLGGDRY